MARTRMRTRSTRVQIKTMMGKTVEFQLISSTCTLLDLKLKIMKEMGLFPDDMILFHGDVELEDEDKTLEEYGIGEDMDTILLIVDTGLMDMDTILLMIKTGLMGWY